MKSRFLQPKFAENPLCCILPYKDVFFLFGKNTPAEEKRCHKSNKKECEKRKEKPKILVDRWYFHRYNN